MSNNYETVMLAPASALTSVSAPVPAPASASALVLTSASASALAPMSAPALELASVTAPVAKKKCMKHLSIQIPRSNPQISLNTGRLQELFECMEVVPVGNKRKRD